MRHVSFFIAAALPALAQASTPYQFDLTGEQFAAALQNQPATEQEYRARDRAYAYLDGAKDATVGMLWCPTKPHKTVELAYDAADHIRALAAEQRKGNAAQLLLAYLAKQFPCAGGQR